MKTHHSCLLGRLSLLSALVLSSGHLAAEPLRWTPVKIGEREYIPLDQVQEFYGFQKATRSGASVELKKSAVSLKLEAGSADSTLNRMKLTLGNPVLEADGKLLISRSDLSGLLDPTLRPGNIPRTGRIRTIILDPVLPGGTEAGSDPTLKIATLLRKQLEEQDFKVVLTRYSSTATPPNRTVTANSVTDGAIFVSITLGGEGEKERGIATAAISGSGQGSVPLAVAIHGSVTRKLGRNTVDNGVRQGDDKVLAEVKHPVVAIRIGSPSDTYEARLLANPQYQETLAAGIAYGIGKYRGATKAASSAE